MLMLVGKLDEYTHELFVASVGVLALAIGVFAESMGSEHAIFQGTGVCIGLLGASLAFALFRPTYAWRWSRALRKVVVICLLVWGILSLEVFCFKYLVKCDTISVYIGAVVSASTAVFVLVMSEFTLHDTVTNEKIYRKVIGLLLISLALFTRGLFDSTTDWAWWMAAPLAGIILGLTLEALGKEVKGCGPGCLTVLLSLSAIAFGPGAPDTWMLKVHIAVALVVAALFVFLRTNSWSNRDEGW